MSDPLEFTLPNVATGPDHVSLSALAADHDGVLVLFQRDYHCGNCRKQVQAVAERHAEFQRRNVAVVSVVPEPADRLRDWQDSYDLPFPLLADPGADVGDAYDQPTRFGFLGNRIDLLGRMPKAVLLDSSDGDLTVAYSHEGDSTWDRPKVDDLLAAAADLG